MGKRFCLCVKAATPPGRRSGNFGQFSQKTRGKVMRKVIRASLLVLALSCPAYAGYIPNNSPDAAPTPQPTPITSSITQEPADVHVQSNEPAESTVTDVVLNFVQTVLSLF
jgi:hypothetical protein